MVKIGLFGQEHRIKPDVFANECAKFVGTYFAQTFEPGYLRLAAQFFDGLFFFRFGITVKCLLLVAHPEKRRIEDIEVAIADHIREKLKEKRKHQQPDVHPVHIGVGSNHHPVVPQVFERIFNVQGVLQQVELLVLIHDFLGQTITVKGFTTQAEHRLGVYIPRFGNGTAGRIAFRDKNSGGEPNFLRAFFIQVIAAVPEFFVVDISGFGALVGEFFYL